MKQTYIYPANEFVMVDDAMLIGEGTSQERGKSRWGTIRIFVAGNAYIVEVCGRSTVPGENDRWHLHVYHNATDMLRSLLRGPSKRLPNHVFAAMDQAADFDPEIDEALATYEGVAAWR